MECVLKDLIAISKDGEWGKGEPFDDSVEMLAIRGTDFEDVRFGYTASIPRRHIARRHAERKLLQSWDVIIEAAGGTKNQITGRTVLLRPPLFSRSELPFTCASFSRFIRFNTDLCSPEFMFWYLQHLYASGLMHAYHTQHTGVARFQWTTFSEREPLEIPTLSVQRRIAGVLSAYDELIENIQRRIRILETMARTLYREWFVLFRFPGHEKLPRVASPLGEIPHGWAVSEFRDLFDIRYGKTLPKSEISGSGPYPVYGAGDVIGFYDKMLCPEKCALVTSRGNGSGTVWRTREAAFVTNNSLIMLPRKDHGHWDYSFVELLLKHANVMEAKTGSAQPQVTIENLNYVKAIVPAKPLVEKFCGIATPTYEQVDLLFRQIQNLRRTRDLLLPRLLSGQIPLQVSTVEETAVTMTPARSETEFEPEEPALRVAEESPPYRLGNGTHAVENDGHNGAHASPMPIDQIDRTEVLQVIRQVFSEGPPRERDNAIRDVARALGYRRTGTRIQEILHTDLLTAVRRGILENTGGELRLLTRSITDYERDFLKQQFLAAIGRSWIDREDATRDFCRWLGFARTGPIIEDTARSLINGLLREQRLEADGPNLIRRTP